MKERQDFLKRLLIHMHSGNTEVNSLSKQDKHVTQKQPDGNSKSSFDV